MHRILHTEMLIQRYISLLGGSRVHHKPSPQQRWYMYQNVFQNAQIAESIVYKAKSQRAGQHERLASFRVDSPSVLASQVYTKHTQQLPIQIYAESTLAYPAGE
ncbi:hypothetical protein BaRGS_00003627 [Batillaria attramentaria]|uniref:Uncharacterized protein n=1 Tax=Batillaria attramentaria TaxID=370345 RepID=A0ABD0M088_9CAEN